MISTLKPNCITESVWKENVHIPVPFFWVLKNRKQDAERDLLHSSHSVGRRSCAAASSLVYSFSKVWCAVSSLAPLRYISTSLLLRYHTTK